MTTAQLNHLRRIDALLASLLSTAEKRSSGEWHKECHDNSFVHGCAVGDKKHGLIASRLTQGNAAFIASCAGNAEAGWRATRAAIALCIANLHTDPEFPTHEAGEICDNDGQGCRACGYTERILLQSILAAFPNI